MARIDSYSDKPRGQAHATLVRTRAPRTPQVSSLGLPFPDPPGPLPGSESAVSTSTSPPLRAPKAPRLWFLRASLHTEGAVRMPLSLPPYHGPDRHWVLLSLTSSPLAVPACLQIQANRSQRALHSQRTKTWQHSGPLPDPGMHRRIGLAFKLCGKMAAAGAEPQILVQYLVLRKDLSQAPFSWPAGALVAQACHAATAALHIHRDHPHTAAYLRELGRMRKVVLEVRRGRRGRGPEDIETGRGCRLELEGLTSWSGCGISGEGCFTYKFW